MLMRAHAALAIVMLASTTVFAAAALTPKFEHQQIDKIRIGYGLAIGEVDGDGKPDILLADAKQFVWYRNPGKRGVAWKKYVMVENLTPRDNVCIAARDINGDGRVEVAVGAMWNPGQTTNAEQSGSVHYLIRPKDPTQKWQPVKLHHEPTVHRMHWARTGEKNYQLVVLPLHGRGNKGGQGAGVRLLAYQMPDNPTDEWKTTVIDESMHLTHNFDTIEFTQGNNHTVRGMLIAGKEGLRAAVFDDGKWRVPDGGSEHFSNAAGEVRGLPATTAEGMNYIVTIEPMHGNRVAVHSGRNRDPQPKRTVLDESLNQGHALAIADLLGAGRPQVVVGWRNPDKDRKVGIKMYVATEDDFSKFETHLIDDNQMACEDLKVADLDGDGKPDIIAAGRRTQNVKIYWNNTGK